MSDVVVLLEDVGTVLCGGFNAWHFAGQFAVAAQRPGRRLAAAALALVNAAVVAEGVLFLALYWWHAWGHPVDAFFEAPLWPVARSLPLAGTALVSALIVRGRRRR